MSTVTFAQLGVPASIHISLARRGITNPFEIQAAAIADGLAGRDICGRAPTGSGKTLAFGIPLVAKVGRAEPKRPRALVLAPTRELAEQISTEIRTFSGSIRIGVVYGGVGYGEQFKMLRQGVDILVACPGRLEDLIQQRVVDLSAVDKVVLDEADRMADMGFMPAVRRLLDKTSQKRQMMLFSATLDDDVAKLIRDYQHDPVRHEVGEETPDITAASHVFWNVERGDRTAVTAEAVNAAWPSIVFCRTKHGADRLAKQLDKLGIKSVAIHGGRSQNQRTRALADFSNGKVHALVASDVAARGIHVDGVASVVHYDPPEDHKTYVHRSGRTARAGQGGVVVSLVQPNQLSDVRMIQRKAGLEQRFTAPDAGALRTLTPTPVRKLVPERLAQEPVAVSPQPRPSTNPQPVNPNERRQPRAGDGSNRGIPSGDAKPEASARQNRRNRWRSRRGTSGYGAPRPVTQAG
jgi:superfamily II DNA/RNA helicase